MDKNNEMVILNARILMLLRAGKEAVEELRRLGSSVQANALEMRLKGVDSLYKESVGVSVLKNS